MSGIGLGALHAASTTIQNLAFAWLIGSVLLGPWISRATDTEPLDLHRRLWRSTAVAAALLVVAQGGLLWLEAAVMADVSLADAMPAVADVLRGTHFGAVWTFGFVVSAAVFALSTLWPKHKAKNIHAAALAIALAAFGFTRSLISHAAGHGDLGFAVVLDWIHLLLIGAWIGEVFVAALIVLPRLNAAVVGESLAAVRAFKFVLALSRSATVILGGVLVTGIVKAWQSVGSLDQLVGNPYGNALTIKLIWVAAAIGLGGFNRFVVLPTFDPRGAHASAQQRPNGLVRFLFVLRLQSLILIGVTIAAAVLSASAPPVGGQ